MSRATIVLWGKVDRARAAQLIATVPPGSRVEVKGPRRSLPQNDRMWAMLTDVARQVVWYGEKLPPEDWKDVFTASLRKARVVPGLDGGFVPLGMRTSEMSVSEMADLMTLMEAFGAERGVEWSEPEKAAA